MERRMNKEAILEKMRGTSTHGNCCTCPKCKHFHDDCMCHAIARLENILNSLVSGDEGRLECGCQWLSHTEIAKRKWGEYKEFLRINYPKGQDFPDWLDSREHKCTLSPTGKHAIFECDCGRTWSLEE